MQEYASQRGLRRTMIPVPVLTPRLSSLWLWLVTPVYAGVGRKLVDSLQERDGRRGSIVRSRCSAVRPRGIRDAIARALAFEDQGDRARRAGRTRRSPRRPVVRRRATRARASSTPGRPRWLLPPARAFAPIQAIGGETGWYKGARALAPARPARRPRRRPRPPSGAARSRSGSRSATRSISGASRRSSRIACCGLNAEMKVPGRAWLQFEVTPAARRCRLDRHPDCDLRPVRASSASSTGTALWPFHGYIFGGMLRASSGGALRSREYVDVEAQIDTDTSHPRL